MADTNATGGAPSAANGTAAPAEAPIAGAPAGDAPARRSTVEAGPEGASPAGSDGSAAPADGRAPAVQAPPPDGAGGRRKSLVLALTAIGVVFGDIGTSPLYALRECFSPVHGIPREPENVFGLVSLIFWSISLVVCVKYLLVVLRADNRGEGGILALIALVGRRLASERKGRTAFVALLGIVGAALLLSDGIITPAISVLSAVEGLEVVSPSIKPFVVPLSLVVLVALFPLQSRGTARMGRLFGPVLSIWFLVISVLGIASIAQRPQILAALSPHHAVAFLAREGLASFGVLGSVFLALTGAEVMYADLGHFGRRPIRTAWFSLIYPALVLNYLGQGAFLLANPDQVDNLFFRLAPTWSVYPLVALATAATIIASQAVISGAFSLASQSVQLGYWPRILVRHTSSESIGQVYVPSINWFLLFGTVGLVLGFRESGNLANAYGIAVSTTMLMTTCLTSFLARTRWKARLWAIVPFAALFLVVDSSFFLSNAIKIVSGGWIVVAFALAIYLLMKTWMDGRAIFREKMRAFRLAPEDFAASIALNPPTRVQGSAVFLTGDPQGVPKALLHNLKHNRVLHERTIILSVRTIEEPFVDEAERIESVPLEGGIWKIVVSYGFSETPDIPAALARVEVPGFSPSAMNTAYFIGREALVVVPRRGTMGLFRKKLFGFMFNNALNATDYFRLPPNRVIEIGAQTEL